MKSWGWGVRCHRWGERAKIVCNHGVRLFVVIFRVKSRFLDTPTKIWKWKWGKMHRAAASV